VQTFTKSIIAFVILFALGLAIGGSGVYVYYSRQLTERDTELGKFADRYRELEQDYNLIRATEANLRESFERRQELDRRTAEAVSNLGVSIDSISVQGKNIEEKLRGIIKSLKEIESRFRTLENSYNSYRNASTYWRSYYNRYSNS